MSATTERLERHQIAIYLAGIAAGVATGLLIPGARHLEAAINPVIALLLYATFLGVPFTAISRAFTDARFLLTVLALNFALVPVVVYALSRVVADEPAVLFGVLLVLLSPCIDYVIVFARLAGGAADRLLAAAPLLMLAQALLLPVYLWVMVGPRAARAVEVGPFAHALVVLIVLPLAAAALTQVLVGQSTQSQGKDDRRRPWWARWAAQLQEVTLAAMVPLMFATLAVVIASQVRAVSGQLGRLMELVPLYVGFAVAMVLLGLVVARFARLDVTSGRAVVFSGVTRNSLVVLPLALALPASQSLTPLVVVTQTLVELVVMVVLVRVLPLTNRPKPAGAEAVALDEVER
ncbi:arsenic resistance protein [Quadrisphaera setariae]|uniref:arsenic resistance protein n=1 Tax=Quadrisphaera TaxID=317661 RepID=UPI003F70003A